MCCVFWVWGAFYYFVSPLSLPPFNYKRVWIGVDELEIQRNNRPTLLQLHRRLHHRWLTNADTSLRGLVRVLCHLHGRPLLHLPRLLSPHKRRLRRYLHRRYAGIFSRRRGVLHYRPRHACGCEVDSRGWGQLFWGCDVGGKLLFLQM